MKRIIVLSIFIVLNTFGFTQGINFSDDHWKEITEQSSKSGTYIFVEVFGKWCSVCRNIEKNVFSEPAVYSFYNLNFLNFRVDGDKQEYDSLIQKWNITAYPALLIINPNGDVIASHTGYINSLDLLQFGAEILDYEQDLLKIDGIYDQSKVKSFLLNYQGIDDKRKVDYLEKYLSTLPDMSALNQEDTDILLSAIPVASDLIINRLLDFFRSDRSGENFKEPLQKLDGRIRDLANDSNDEDSIRQYNGMRETLCLLRSNDYPQECSDIQIELEDDLLSLYGSRTDYNEAYHKLATHIVSTRFLPLDPQKINREDGFLNYQITPNNPRTRATSVVTYLNTICLYFYQNFEEVSVLENTLEWINHSIAIMPQARSYLIAAGISNTLGNQQMAEYYFQKALEQKDFPEQKFIFSELISRFH